MTTRFAAIFAALALSCYALPALAATYTTAGAAPSTLTLQVWVGAPGGEIQPGTPSILATIGPLGVNGTANLTLNVDGGGNGTVSFDTSSLIVDDVSNFFVDLVTGVPDGGVLTTNLDLLGAGVGLRSDAIPLQGGIWNVDGIGAPSVLNVGLNEGSISLHDHGGPFGGLLDDPTEINLTTDPVAVGLADLLGLNINGTADTSAVSFNIPAIDIDLGESAFGLPGLLFVRLEGQINLVPVPEPGSIVMLGLGLVGLVAVGCRRARKA